MSDGVSMVFFRSGAFGLADAERVLAERGLDVARRGHRLAVQWCGGPELRIVLATGAHVGAEAAEIGEGGPHARALGGCDVRFEISFDSLDEVLDEINTLIEVQATLQQATGGFQFNTWNGRLVAPGG